MTTIHVKLKKGENKIKLFHPMSRKSRVRVMNALVFWTFENIRDNNNTFLVDSVEKTLSKGYYTFTSMKEELAKHDITIQKNYDNTLSLTSTKDVQLKKLGPLLGFDADVSLVKTTKHVSPRKIDLANGLRDIRIYCDLVNDQKNYNYYGGEYHFSTLFLTLPIDSTQNMNGVYTQYSFENYYVSCHLLSEVNEMAFFVGSGGEKEDYELDLVLVFE